MGRALIVREPGRVDLEFRELPHPSDGEVLVRPMVVGLCATDLEIVDGRIDPAYVRYPLTLGHEWSGVVIDDPSRKLDPGTRVVAEGIVPCGRCSWCLEGATNLCDTYDELGFTRDGAAADALLVSASLVHPLANDISFEDGALVEPAAVVHRAISRLTARSADRALVIGDGTIALLATQLLQLHSIREILMLGRRAEQAELAARAGATRFEVDSERLGGGFDIVVEAAGAVEAANTAIAAARRGATVVLLGLPPHGETAQVAIDDVVNADLTIFGSFAYTSAAWSEVVQLLNVGQLRLSDIVTHRYPLEEWRGALDTLRNASGCRGKVLIELGEGS